MRNIFRITSGLLVYLIFIYGSPLAGQDTLSNESLSAFLEGKSMGLLENDEINEASGLEASINNPGLLWTHNDSGDTARIFLINKNGSNVGIFYLQNIINRDWEDMTLGPGPEEGKHYLYLAEMGDNRAVHKYQYIYRFEEPVLKGSNNIGNIEKLTFQYPDGNRDAECLMIDPTTKDLYVVSKREKNVRIYVARYPQTTEHTIVLKKVGILPHHNIVAGDISADGKEIIVKTYSEILYWIRGDNESLIDALKKPAIKIPYKYEPQGEAIAWEKDGSGFFTLSEEPEGIDAGVYYYERR